MKNSFKLMLIVFFIVLNNENSFSQIKTLSDLELTGDIEGIKITETAVKGPKYELIRKHIISEDEYKVISNDNILHIKHTESGIISNYKYDKNNKLIEIESKHADKYNVLTGRRVYNYNSGGKLIYELDYDKKDALKDSISVNYLGNHTVVRRFYTAKGEFYKIEEIIYNEKEQEISNIQEIGGSKTRIENEYDSTGINKLIEKWILDGRLIQKIVYNYNDKGWLTHKIEYDSKGEEGSTTHLEYNIITGLLSSIKYGEHVTTYDYNFDVNDNWTTKYEYYDDYPVKITEREIKYRGK